MVAKWLTARLETFLTEQVGFRLELPGTVALGRVRLRDASGQSPLFGYDYICTFRPVHSLLISYRQAPL